MNAFTDYAEKQTPAAVKARQRATEKRRAAAAEKAAQKALAERDDLFALWKVWRKERLNTLLSGPHGSAAQALVAFLQTMTLGDGARLVEHVRVADWEHTDEDTRFEVMSLIDHAIATLRTRAKLTPFDDPLSDLFGGGSLSDPFLILRELLR
jgi:hypothetical protein